MRVGSAFLSLEERAFLALTFANDFSVMDTTYFAWTISSRAHEKTLLILSHTHTFNLLDTT